MTTNGAALCKEKPYLSIVLTGRNDNYGGDFIERLQRSLSWNTELFEKFGIYTEIILVNWNPLPENNSLHQLIEWPKKRNYVRYRIITVPPDIHETFINPTIRETVPIFEFIAKNTGLRRAKGEYLLCTNADILFHPSIVQFIAGKNLTPKNYYRADMIDFKKDLQNFDLQSLFKAAQVVYLKGFTYTFNDWVNKYWQYELFKWINTFKLKKEAFILRNDAFFNVVKVPIIYDNASLIAHCNYSGDFMLTHSANWHELRGYPQKTRSTLHTDALMTIMAYSRLQEVVLDKPIFHQEHRRRQDRDKINNEYKTVFNEFEKSAKEILYNNKIDCINSSKWGLGDYNLNELHL